MILLSSWQNHFSDNLQFSTHREYPEENTHVEDIGWKKKMGYYIFPMPIQKHELVHVLKDMSVLMFSTYINPFLPQPQVCTTVDITMECHLTENLCGS